MASMAGLSNNEPDVSLAGKVGSGIALHFRNYVVPPFLEERDREDAVEDFTHNRGVSLAGTSEVGETPTRNAVGARSCQELGNRRVIVGPERELCEAGQLISPSATEASPRSRPRGSIKGSSGNATSAMSARP